MDNITQRPYTKRITDGILLTDMSYANARVAEVAETLKSRLQELENKADILRAVELRGLYAEITRVPPEERANFGKEINDLKAELESLVGESESSESKLKPIDVTAPFDANVLADNRPGLLPSEQGSKHPLMTELENILDIFYRMGFHAVESRQLDDDYHMFETLNFPG